MIFFVVFTKFIRIRIFLNQNLENAKSFSKLSTKYVLVKYILINIDTQFHVLSWLKIINLVPFFVSHSTFDCQTSECSLELFFFKFFVDWLENWKYQWNELSCCQTLFQEFSRNKWFVSYKTILSMFWSKTFSQLLSDDIWSNTKFFWRREDRIEQETSWRYSLWSDFAATISRDFFFFLTENTL